MSGLLTVGAGPETLRPDAPSREGDGLRDLAVFSLLDDEV